MAIPFNLPTDEETEDTYRRIDQFLLDLYDLLRQIILRQRTYPRDREGEAVAMESEEAQRPTRVRSREVEEEPLPRFDSRVLPDLVPETLPVVRKAPSRQMVRRRRRMDKPARRYQLAQRTPYEDLRTTTATAPAPARPAPGWLNVGIELRQIAEEITFISRNGNSTTTKRRNEIKASSLFSLLVPAPVTGTIWTTVIILVGWRLLSKQR